MKRILVMLIICLGFTVVKADVFPYNYGHYLTKYDMTEQLTSPLYWYMYMGRDYITRCEEVSHGGKYSLKLDTLSASAASQNNMILNFATEPITNLYQYDNNDFLCEFYVKGTETDLSKMPFSCYFEFDDGSKYNFKTFNVVSEEDGWFRVYGFVSGKDVKDFKTTYLSVWYIADGTEEGYVYLDDMSIRLVPSYISADSRSVYAGESVKLSDINVRAYDNNGNMSFVDDKSALIWSVADENAYIDNGVLYYNGNAGGSVVVNCEYMGKTTDLTLNFKEKVSYQFSEYADGNITASVTNNYWDKTNVKILAALYDGSSLYNVYTTSGDIESLKTATFEIKGIHIPHIIDNPKIIIYTIDSTGDCGIHNYLNDVKG